MLILKTPRFRMLKTSALLYSVFTKLNSYAFQSVNEISLNDLTPMKKSLKFSNFKLEYGIFANMNLFGETGIRYLCKYEFIWKNVEDCVSGAQISSIHKNNQFQKSRYTATSMTLRLERVENRTFSH